MPLLNKIERFLFKHFDQIFIFENNIYYVDLKNNNIPYNKYCKIFTKIMENRIYKKKIRVVLKIKISL